MEQPRPTTRQYSDIVKSSIRVQLCKSWNISRFTIFRIATATPYTHTEWLLSQVNDRWDTWQRYVQILFHILPLPIHLTRHFLLSTISSTTTTPPVSSLSNGQQLCPIVPFGESPFLPRKTPRVVPHPHLRTAGLRATFFATRSSAIWIPSNATTLFLPLVQRAALRSEKNILLGAILRSNYRTIFNAVHPPFSLASKTSPESFHHLMR